MIVNGVLQQVGAIAAIGILPGGAGASLVADAVSGFLFGIEPGDTQTLVAAGAVLGRHGAAGRLRPRPARVAGRADRGIARRMFHGTDWSQASGAAHRHGSTSG